tara:strand:- start:97 stop:735 length:639 start_codon:yes stop_codon:yes gene_type:complete
MKYQDFVIKDGRFIGKFEEMYKKFPDPWQLLKNNSNSQNINYQIIYNYCERVRDLKRKKKFITLEIGCGYPQISNNLFKKGFRSFGTDISETVIIKSKKKYPKLKNKLFVSEFDNFRLYEKINPDIIILSDVSWYILSELKNFLKWFRKIKKKTYLIHSLAIYEKNVQNYGKDYFYDMQTIKKFFNLKILSQVEIKNLDSDWHTIFLASNKK